MCSLPLPPLSFASQFRFLYALGREERECFYCHELGHLIADCQLRMRNHPPPVQQPKGVGLISTVSCCVAVMPNVCVSDLPDPNYKPFILSGLVSLTGDPKDQQKVQSLRDTGAVVYPL